MEDADLKTSPTANPWRPMTDQVDVAHLDKLLEELGEAVSAAARCLCQGIDEAHPITGKVNKEWLEDELADVLICSRQAIARFGLDVGRMHMRAQMKGTHLTSWHDQLPLP